MNLPFYDHELRVQGSQLIKTERVYFYTDIARNEYNFRRYLNPTGWSRKMFVFESYKEGEKTFDKIGQSPVPPVENFELENYLEEIKYYNEQSLSSFHKYMNDLGF
jgi:hypothetical protein